jgi:hypothetical protein
MNCPSVAVDSHPIAYMGLVDAARLCPSTRPGKRVHTSTLTRWIIRGFRLRDGSIRKLTARRFPGGWAVSREAIDEFVDTITRDRCGEPVSVASPPTDSRRRAIARADAELARLGV